MMLGPGTSRGSVALDSLGRPVSGFRPFSSCEILSIRRNQTPARVHTSRFFFSKPWPAWVWVGFLWGPFVLPIHSRLILFGTLFFRPQTVFPCTTPILKKNHISQPKPSTPNHPLQIFHSLLQTIPPPLYHPLSKPSPTRLLSAPLLKV